MRYGRMKGKEMAQVTLVGNLGRDVEVRNTPNGTEVASFSIPDNVWVSGAVQTTWFNCTVWEPSDFIKNLKKGSSIQCVGSFAPRTYPKKDGSGEGISFDVKVYGDSVQYTPGRSRQNTESSDGEAGSEDAPF